MYPSVKFVNDADPVNTAPFIAAIAVEFTARYPLTPTPIIIFLPELLFLIIPSPTTEPFANCPAAAAAAISMSLDVLPMPMDEKFAELPL